MKNVRRKNDNGFSLRISMPRYCFLCKCDLNDF